MKTLALSLLVGGIAVGCGPSVQVIHEGGVRFEHCYRLDLDRSIANSHRAACWKTWRTRYSYGQSRDRLEYADRRLDQIKRGQPPPSLQLDADRKPLATDAPVDAHAPPPKVAETERPAATAQIDPTAARSEPSVSAPGDACAGKCRNAREACLTSCDPASTEQCDCEPAYRRCMQACFQ